MSEENNVPKEPCSTEGHRRHLCKLAEDFFHLHHADQYKAMVEKPQYKCIFCGRAANSDKYLCYPEKL